jgi:hypothetical protein
MMKVLLAIFLFAAPTIAETFKFDNVMYHAEVIPHPNRPPAFENLDIFILNGEYDIEKGGSVTVTNSNGTYADSSSSLTPQFKTEPQTPEWESNTTLTLTKKSGSNATTIFGRVLFMPNGKEMIAREIVWYTSVSPTSYAQEVGAWIVGE